MYCYEPEADADQIAARLGDPNTLLIACLCADWCGVCRDFRVPFIGLARAHPNACFVWVDVEDHAELIDDIEIENFPTVLLQGDDQAYFFGTILPHAGVLERLLGDLSACHIGEVEAPDLRAALRRKG